MNYVHTLTTISLLSSSLMHLITNFDAVHASCKQANQLHIKARSLIVLKWITPLLTKNSFVLLWHYKISTLSCLVLNYMSTLITKTFSILVTSHSVDYVGSPTLMNMGQNCIMWKDHLMLLDTFSRLLYNDVSSPLLGKKAANIVSNSESDNEYDSVYLSLLDDREILDCPLNFPCFSSNKKRKRKTHNRKKHWYKSASSSSESLSLLSNVIWISLKTWLKTTLSIWRTSRENKIIMTDSHSQQLNIQLGIVARLLTILKTSYVTLNQVTMQPIGELHFLKT